MPLVTATGVSRLMIPLLRRALTLGNTVARPSGEEFAGDNGDTITVRVRQPRTALTQASPGAAATFSSISETPVTVQLAHLYDGVNISDQELSLQLVDFATQVTEPQVAAVATGIEDRLVTAMNAVAADNATLVAGTAKAQILAARQDLSQNLVPPGDRWCAISPAAVTFVLDIDGFQRDAAASGDTSALREAIIGRYMGFTFVECAGLTGGANGASMVFYHRSGFALANRAPIAPRGAGGQGESASVSDSGFGLRQIFQYNPATLSDQSVVSSFAGASVVDLTRIYKARGA